MKKIWLQHYADDVPFEVDVSQYHSLNDMFVSACRRFPRHVAFCNMGSSISYHKLDQAVTHIAGFLQQKLGLRKGDRLALMLPNCLQFVAVMLAALRVGIVVVNVNPLYTVPELTHQLNDSESYAIVVLANFAHVVEKALPGINYLKHIIVTELGDMFAWPKRNIVNFAVRAIKHMVPTYTLPNAILFRHMLRSSRRYKMKPVMLEREDIAFLQYTGGTTGVAKGAILTHGNMLTNVMQNVVWSKNLLRDGSEVVFVALPMYHIFSLTVCCFNFIEKGGKGVLITNPRDISDLVRTWAKTQPTVFVGVNTLFNALNHHERFKKLNFSCLKLVIAGGMALQETVAAHWREITGVPISQGYGLTEASPVVSFNPLYIDHFNGSIGLPLPSTEVSIRDQQGQEVPIGEEGELWVRGPQVMRGYWHNVKATQEVLMSDGWLKTGDIARIDTAGYIYLIDRIKDMIIVSGFNVYPNEVEHVLASYPGVAEVAVVGVSSEKTGQAVKAIIVCEDDKLDEASLIAFCRQRLTAYKIPKIIEFRDSLPKSTVGKVLRRELRSSA